MTNYTVKRWQLIRWVKIYVKRRQLLSTTETLIFVSLISINIFFIIYSSYTHSYTESVYCSHVYLV